MIPPLVNTFIAFFKDTSLVLIIGIFDLLTTAKTAIIDPAWQSFSVEVYVFVGLIYFVVLLRHVALQPAAGNAAGGEVIYGAYSSIELDWCGLIDVRCAPIATKSRVAAK